MVDKHRASPGRSGGRNNFSITQKHKRLRSFSIFLSESYSTILPGLASCFLTITNIIAHEGCISQNYF